MGSRGVEWGGGRPRAGGWLLVGLVCLAGIAGAAGCRGRGDAASAPDRSVPPEWIGLDGPAPDVAGSVGPTIPGAVDAGDDAVAPEVVDEADAEAPIVAAPPAAALAVGKRHACWIRPDRRVVCWGTNDVGQVDGRPGPLDGPRLVPGVEGAVEIRAFLDGSCVRTERGAVRCWGDVEAVPRGERVTDVVQRNDRDWTDPRGGLACTLSAQGSVVCADPRLSGAGTGPTGLAGVAGEVRELAVAGDLACVRLAAGGIRCWTAEDRERKADGSVGAWQVRELPELVDVVQLVAGGGMVCARRELGEVSCVVAGPPTVDGAGAAVRPLQPVPVAVEGAVALDAEIAFCALRRDGGTACWGVPVPNAQGRLPGRISPVAVSGLAGATALAVAEVGCALDAGGALACWDLSGFHSDAHPRALQAHRVEGIYGALQVVALADVACVRDAGGGVACRRLDDETTEPVPTVAEALDLVATRDAFCALSRGGWLRCWTPQTPVIESEVFTASAAEDAVGLAAIGGDVCARRGGQRWLSCRTRTAGGPRPPAVVPVSAPAETVQLTLATGCSCALTRGGAVSCWGDAFEGGPAPRALDDFARSTALASWKGYGVCALRASGAVTCRAWSGGASEPVDVAGLGNGVEEPAGGPLGLACARMRDGTVRCWRSSPGGTLAAEAVEGVGGATALAVGGVHACVISGAGEAVCWGDANTAGQVGRPPSAEPVAPAVVEGPTGVQALAAGPTATCAATAADEVWCWGSTEDDAQGWQPRRVDGLLDARESRTASTAAVVPAAPSCRLVIDVAEPPLPVRDEPDADAAVLGTLDPGTVVTVAERRDDWLRLETPVPGWIPAANAREACDEAPSGTGQPAAEPLEGGGGGEGADAVAPADAEADGAR
jgi:hypothetical protein